MTGQKKKKTARPKTAAPAAKKILSRTEPKAFEIKNPRGRFPSLIICDHAANRIPKSLGTLGLSRKELQEHIAWDPGTHALGVYLAKMLDAPAILSTYSRLVVDLNRGPYSAECMRKVYDHIRVPGNRKITREERKARLDEIFTPYHDEIDRRLRGFLAEGSIPVVISLHSFTPEMDGFKRPWHIGVLWNKESVIANRLIRNLRQNNPTLKIGSNQPYSLKADNVKKNTISTHAESRGLPYVIVEFRQDLVATQAGARKWGRIFLESLLPILFDPAIYSVRPYHKPARAPRSRAAAPRKKTVRKIKTAKRV